MFSVESIIALVMIAITAKIFDFLGYSRCFAEICNTYDLDSDKLLKDIEENENEKKEDI